MVKIRDAGVADRVAALFTRRCIDYTALSCASRQPGVAMKPVQELLKKQDPTLFQVGPEVMVFDALRLLADYGVGAMLVMDRHRLVGVFSERDYTRKVALQGRNSRDTPVADIMTRDVISVSPDTSTRTCMALMSQKKIRHLPVVDADKVLGMISIRDILDDIIADHEQTISQLQSYITS
jgi:CBS domain-containing protein